MGEVEHKINNQQRNDGVAFIQAFRDPRLEILYRTSLDATGT